MSKKTKAAKLSPGTDDLLHVWGNAYAGLLLYKAATVILAIVVITLSFSVVILAQKAKDVKPLPIFIDRNTGIAEPVAFELIDAAGEKRHETEVKDFVRNYLEDLFTFNIHTAKHNLERCDRRTTPQAWAAVKETLLKDRRMEMVDQDNQGLVEIKLLVIQSVEPEIAIQITFKKILIMAGSNRQETEHVAIIKLHTVKRHEGNAHGLMVVEYRESKND
jgi:hypothetical protein